MPPLPHPRLSRTLRELAATDEHRERCADQPPPLLVRGVEEFNQREFFECHETLEIAWRLEPHPVRFLYQGILHVAVGYYHLRRGNHHGAITKLRTGCEVLEFFIPRCQAVEVAPLIGAATRARERLAELGPARLGDFEDDLIPTIELVGPHPKPHRGPLPPLPNSRAAGQATAEGGAA
jgi:predicted metal-dependent hydrolase